MIDKSTRYFACIDQPWPVVKDKLSHRSPKLDQEIASGCFVYLRLTADEQRAVGIEGNMDLVDECGIAMYVEMP